MTTTGRALMYGPEVWRVDADVEWSYWDLWYAALCVRDHGGDWDGLDAVIAEIGRGEVESPAGPEGTPGDGRPQRR